MVLVSRNVDVDGVDILVGVYLCTWCVPYILWMLMVVIFRNVDANGLQHISECQC
jgi:hypothetical protein